MRKILCLLLLSLLVVTGCPVSPTDEDLKKNNSLKNSVDNTMEIPGVVSNLKASKTDNSRIVLSFKGQKSTDFNSLYYLVNYKVYGETEEKQYTVPSNISGMYSVTFDFPAHGVQVLFSVDTCYELKTTEGDIVKKNVKSSYVVGATLPELNLGVSTSESTVSLFWNKDDLVKNRFFGGDLYEDYYFSLIRETRGIETVIYNKGKDGNYTDKPIGTVKYRLYLNIGDVEIVSQSVTVKPESQLSCPPVDVISVTSGSDALKDGICVSWSVPVLPEDVDEKNTYYRFKLERTVSDLDEWTELFDNGTDIYTEEFSYVGGEYGAASFAYTDSNVELNTKYRYRITSYYYLLNEGFFIPQVGGPVESEEGYMRFEPVDLKIDFENSSHVSDEYNTSVAFNIKLNWSYDGDTDVLYDGVSPVFRIVRINEKNGVSQVITDDLQMDETTYTDSFVLDGIDLFNDASYTYKIDVKYSDDDFSYGTGTDDAYEYEGADEDKQLIRDLRASDNLAGKIVLSWNFRNRGEEHYDSDKIVYSLYYGSDRNDINEKADVEIGKTSAVISNLPDLSRFYYKLVAVYTDDENTEHSDTQITRNPGLTIGSPTVLNMSDGISKNSIDGTFAAVEGAASYRLLYKSESETEWSIKNPESDVISVSEDELSSPAGTEYEFRLYAVDSEGNVTVGYASDTGSLFGTAKLNAVIVSDLSDDSDSTSDSFAVNWDKVNGIRSYVVNVLYGDAVVVTSGTLSPNTVSTTFSANQFRIKNNSVLPETGYSVQMILTNTEDEQITENVGTGSWLYAPTGISASKAESMDSITVSWNEVPGASGYKLYYSHETDSNYNELKLSDLITSNSFKYEFNDISDGTCPDTYFKVMAVSGTHQSLMTDDFENDENGEPVNLGYILKAPENIISHTGDGVSQDGKITLEWNKVNGAQWYIIIDKKGETSREIRVAVEDLENLLNGNLSYTFDDMEMIGEVNWNHEVSIKSGRMIDGHEIESKMSKVETFRLYRYLTAMETLNIIHTKLNVQLQAADKYFKVDKDGDWWPYSANIFNPDNSETYSNGYVVIKNTIGTDYWKGGTGNSSSQSDKNRGSITVSNLPLGGNIFVSSKKIGIGVNGGYAGAVSDNELNQLRSTENPTFTISYPSAFNVNGATPECSVNISSDITFRADDGLAGSYTVKINGINTTIEYSDYYNTPGSVPIRAQYN